MAIELYRMKIFAIWLTFLVVDFVILNEILRNDPKLSAEVELAHEIQCELRYLT